MNLSEAIQACKHKDPLGQKFLFDQYARQMFLLCYRYVKKKEDAEELMLNGFYKFYKNIRKFQYRGESSVLPWLKKVMINECLMFLRKKKELRIVPLNEETEVCIREEIISGISAENIYQLITELPPGYRTVFNLYVIDGMTHREIAKALHITEGTSKSQLNRARSILQTMIIKNELSYKFK